MRYEILGPLRAVHNGDVFTLKAAKTELLLGTMLIRADQVMSTDQLLTELWENELPHRAMSGLHVYVSKLRKFLSAAGGARHAIVTRSPGYMLRLGDAEFDMREFQSLSSRGRSELQRGYAEEARATLESALALWRGPLIGALPGGPITTASALWMDESRLECAELLIDAHMRLGRHSEAVGLLFSLIAENPLREAFYRLLMIALYRSGRRVDALRIYQQAQDVFVSELGLDPSRPLQELRQAILAERPALLAEPAI